MKPEQRDNREDQLESIARKLGAEAAASFDAEASARRVVARLRSERRPIVKAARVLLRVAAVAVIAIGLGVLARAPGGSGDVVAAVPVELADFTEDELTEVFDSLLIDAPVHELAANDIYDMSETELAELLALMES